MNILLINHYAGSIHHGMEYRPYYLGREWVKNGHQVTILAGSYSHVRTVNPELVKNVRIEELGGIKYIWIKTPSYKGNGLRRAINIFTFVGKAMYLHENMMKDHLDAVIASSTYPLDIIPAYRISKNAGAKLIYEVHDLWPLSLIELGGMSRRHPFIQLLQWAEDTAYRKADRVVSILPKAKDYMQLHGMAADKFVHIPNGVNVSEWEHASQDLPEEHTQVFNRLRSRSLFTVGYAGSHGLANALDCLINAATLLKNQPVAFVLVGSGPEKGNLQEEINRRGLDKVSLLPPVSKKSIPTLLQNMDCLYIGLKHEPLFRFGVCPNKLIDYMMASKPVIYAIEAGNNMVEESSCGISVAAENPEAIAQAVLQLCFMSPPEREEIGRKGKEYILAHNDYRVLAQNFLNIL